MSSVRAWSLASGFALALGGGCGQRYAQVNDFDVTPHNFKQINDAVLQVTCSLSKSCHNESGARDANKLNLCSGPKTGSNNMTLCSTESLMDAYDALVGAPAVNKQAKDMGLWLVKPCDPDASFLLTKLSLKDPGDAKIGFGARMPSTSDPLPQPIITAIHDWIARGAHLDEPDDISGTECVSSMLDMSAPLPLDMPQRD